MATGIVKAPVPVSSATTSMPIIPLADLKDKEDLAFGGFGIVFKATWTQRKLAGLAKTRIPVVMKRLRSDMMDHKAEFAREASIWWNLPLHENVLPLYGGNVDCDRPYMVCKLAENGDLTGFLRKNTLTLQEKLSLMLGIARGVLHLHENGITHADLKGENVLVDKQGTPMVSDFGYAKSRFIGNNQSISRRDSTNATIGDEKRWGTTVYLPPERLKLMLEGSMSPPSRAGDVYAFAMICFQILRFGQPPFPDRVRDTSLWEDIAFNNLRPDNQEPSALHQLSSRLAEAIRQSWSRTPENRPSMSLFVEILEIPFSTHSMKFVGVGDGACGLTALYWRFMKGELYTLYVPTILENYEFECRISGLGRNDVNVKLHLADTAGQEQFAYIRTTLQYPGSDAILMCFNIGWQDSFDNVSETWYPEIRQFLPGKPIILVGLQKDLRDHPRNVGLEPPVTQSQGMALASDLSRKSGRTVPYIECSAKTGENINDVFTTAVQAVLQDRRARANAT
ncbi:GTP-binding protein Rho1 [Gonapodya sp. JEL0774]|nr:GTP-binding protein Rho1 [Gonapodya sp. JEL0774]